MVLVISFCEHNLDLIFILQILQIISLLHSNYAIKVNKLNIGNSFASLLRKLDYETKYIVYLLVDPYYTKNDMVLYTLSFLVTYI